MNEPVPTPDRKARFRAALVLAGLTAREWCDNQAIGYPHLFRVLNGERESQSLDEKVDSFIDQYLPPSSTPAA